MPLLWTPSHIIYDQTLPGNATNIDVANLDYNNDGPWQLYLGIQNPLGSAHAYYIYFNGDYVNANYQSQWIQASGGTRTSSRFNTPHIEYLDAGASSIIFGMIMIDALGYARHVGQSCRKLAGSLDLIKYHMGTDNTVANITAIRIASSLANGIGAGTRLILTRIAH